MLPQTPADVLYTHQHLYEVLAHPNAGVVRFYDDFFTQSSRRAIGSDDVLKMSWFSMLYPSRSGAEFLRMLRRPLYASPTFHVNAGIVRAVSATYERSTQEARLQSTDLPVLDNGETAVTGFMWLDEPLFLTDAGGARIGTRAFSWGPQSMPLPPDPRELPEDWQDTDFPGIRLTSWCHVDDTDDFTDQVMARTLISMDMPLSISHSQFMPFGARMPVRDKTRDVVPDDVARWVHTLWMFMQTEVAGLATPEIPRHPNRRQAKRSMGSDLVKVVTLRRVARAGGGEHEARPVDWTCCWVVQSHFRHLEDYSATHERHHAVPMDTDKDHCAVCWARITRVRAYVKGPEGLPLKAVPETVYRVAR